MAKLLWTPDEARKEKANLTRFVAEHTPLNEADFDYDAVHKWSVEAREDFWRAVWDFGGLAATGRGEVVCTDRDAMPGARFFPDARFNFAGNLLKKRGDSDAIVFRGEGKPRRSLSWDRVHIEVSRLAQAMRAMGLEAGDRVAAVLPNAPEAVIAMLAAASIGAVWSSCSPDFGVRGVLDRFSQIEPRLLIGCDGYFYGNKTHDIREKLAAVVDQLPSVEKVIIAAHATDKPDVSMIPRAVNWADAVTGFAPAEIAFAQLPFSHPLYIMFSSGTTGAPKCIVHSAGGTLIQHLKEHQLHCDIKPGDRVFWFTTCGWMMWNWLVSVLASEATIVLFDGSPFHPGPESIFDLIAGEKVTFWGVSAKYIDALKKEELRPRDSHDFSAVRIMGSSGSVLVPEAFEYVYDAILPDVHLASVSGGTDILSCFVGGNPWGAVYKGEIQAPALGMDVQVFNDSGQPVTGEKGELVCPSPFPSMPIGFWNDPDGQKYHDAYFARYPNVWAHGDFCEITATGLVIYGRSDATLNPGGVRIGTAEIYAQVEQMPEVVESIAVGQDWDGDVRVVLFVRLAEDIELDDALIKAIRTRVREGASPRHMPAKVIAVADIPRTKTNKITELAVRDMIHGREVKNIEALANPEALEFYRDIPELGS